jgi:hypothetical protein
MMKKLSVAITTLLLLGLTANLAWGNAFTLKAENGRILAPAGLGINLNSDLVAGSGMAAQASYGIARTVTLAADWQQKNLTLETPTLEGLQLRAYFSPTRGNSGYTAYLGYNPSEQEFTDYGVSFWNNFKFIYTFVNVDFLQTAADRKQAIRLTPGVSFRLTQRLRVGAELATDPFDWKGEELRVGLGYKLFDRLTGKAGVTQTLTGQKDRTYSVGVALEM